MVLPPDMASDDEPGDHLICVGEGPDPVATVVAAEPPPLAMRAAQPSCVPDTYATAAPSGVVTATDTRESTVKLCGSAPVSSVIQSTPLRLNSTDVGAY